MNLRHLALAAAATAALALPGYAQEGNGKLEEEVRMLRMRLEALEKELAEQKKQAAEKEAARTQPGGTQPGGAQPGGAQPGGTQPGGRGAATSPARERFSYSGYIESRFTNVANSRGDRRQEGPEFQISRLRARLNFMPQKNLLTSLEVNAGTRGADPNDVNMREFYFQYQNANRFVRVGQQRVPFGYQVGLESSRNRAALERARVFTVLFPNERDIGVTFGLNSAIANPGHRRNAPRVAFGILNGEGINRSDANRDKSYAGSVTYPLGAHEVGASFYTGSSTRNVFGDVVRDQEKRAFGFDHRFTSGRFGTQFEVLTGDLFGASFYGGYAQLLYNLGRYGNLFTRGDVFDPDTGAGSDYWRRISVGWFKDFGPNFRLTAEYDVVRNGLTRIKNDDTFGIEAQAGF